MNFCFLTGHSWRLYKRLARRPQPYTAEEKKFNQWRVCNKCGKRELYKLWPDVALDMAQLGRLEMKYIKDNLQ